MAMTQDPFGLSKGLHDLRIKYDEYLGDYARIS